MEVHLRLNIVRRLDSLMKDIYLVRSISEYIDDRTRVISRSFNNVDTFFNNYLRVANIIWRGYGWKQGDVDSEGFGSQLSASSYPRLISMAK